MRWAPVAIAVAIVAGFALAGSNGMGTGGLQGFPNPTASNGAPVGPACITTATGIYCGVVDAGTVYAANGKFDILDAGVLNVQGQVTVAGPVIGASTCSATQYNISGTGSIFGGSAAGLTAGGTHIRGNVANGAAAIAASTANNPALTAGMDRFIHNFYNDNFSTLQAQVTSDGTYLGGYGPVTKAASKTAPTVTACSGGTAATMTWSNGTVNFRFDVGTACTGESTAVITLPTVANAWTCVCWNIAAPTHNIHQSGFGATSATMTNYAATLATATDWVDSADIQCMCLGG